MMNAPNLLLVFLLIWNFIAFLYYREKSKSQKKISELDAQLLRSKGNLIDAQSNYINIQKKHIELLKEELELKDMTLNSKNINPN
jgi:hypothetical protein